MSISTAAWRSPTSTDTPCAVAGDAPGTLDRMAPNARDMVLPRAWTPGISWVDMAAIFATTDDEIDVVPCSLVSAAPAPPPERSRLRDDDRTEPLDGALSDRPDSAGLGVPAELGVSAGVGEVGFRVGFSVMG